MDTDALSEEYKGEALQELEEFRLNKTMGSRSSNMAAYADARATTAAVTQEVCLHITLESHSNHSVRLWV